MAFVPTEGIRIEAVPSGQTLQTLLESGKLDAILSSFKSRLNKTDRLNFKKSPSASEVRLMIPKPSFSDTAVRKEFFT